MHLHHHLLTTMRPTTSTLVKGTVLAGVCLRTEAVEGGGGWGEVVGVLVVVVINVGFNFVVVFTIIIFVVVVVMVIIVIVVVMVIIVVVVVMVIYSVVTSGSVFAGVGVAGVDELL